MLDELIDAAEEKEFALYLKELVLKKGSWRNAAKIAGIDHSLLIRYGRNEKCPTEETVLMIAEKLQFTETEKNKLLELRRCREIGRDRYLFELYLKKLKQNPQKLSEEQMELEEEHETEELWSGIAGKQLETPADFKMALRFLIRGAKNVFWDAKLDEDTSYIQTCIASCKEEKCSMTQIVACDEEESSWKMLEYVRQLQKLFFIIPEYRLYIYFSQKNGEKLQTLFSEKGMIMFYAHGGELHGIFSSNNCGSHFFERNLKRKLEFCILFGENREKSEYGESWVLLENQEIEVLVMEEWFVWKQKHKKATWDFCIRKSLFPPMERYEIENTT